MLYMNVKAPELTLRCTQCHSDLLTVSEDEAVDGRVLATITQRHAEQDHAPAQRAAAALTG